MSIFGYKQGVEPNLLAQVTKAKPINAINSDLRHGQEFDCNLEASFDLDARLQFIIS